MVRAYQLPLQLIAIGSSRKRHNAKAKIAI
jgi:hypothetical protein